MTKEQIIEMAREAGFNVEQGFLLRLTFTSPSNLERFAHLVAAAEREACAKVCENMSGPIETYNPKYVHYIGCAAAIRERGKE
jgi:hypothetical protein